MTTEQNTTERGPWAVEPELPPDHGSDAVPPLDARLVQARLSELLGDAHHHADQANADVARLSTMLTAEPAAQSEHLAAVRRLAAAEQTMIDVRVAQARLEDGTYGLCARCGQVVDPARLEMRPASRYCVRCS